MKKKQAKTIKRNTPKWENSETIAAKLGVSKSAVYAWRARGTQPKNPNIRAIYLRLIGGGK